MLQGHGQPWSRRCSSERPLSEREEPRLARKGASGISSTSLSTRSVSASRVRARSVPAASSPTAHRPGVDLRPFASGSRAPAAQQQTGPQYYNVGTPPQQAPVPTLPQQLPVKPWPRRQHCESVSTDDAGPGRADQGPGGPSATAH